MIEVFKRLKFFHKYLGLFNILILSGAIALFSTISTSINKYKFKQCSPKISVLLKCNIIFYLHSVLVYFNYILLFKLLFFPINVIDYLIITIIILIIFILGTYFKRCILTILEQKCRKCPANYAFGGDKLSHQEIIAMRNGYINQKFVGGLRYFVILLVIVTIKFLIEKMYFSNKN